MINMIDPVAFQFGGMEIRWYGIFSALAFLAGYIVIKYRAKARQLPAEIIDKLIFLILIAGVVGARVMYVVTNVQEFQGRWLEALMLWQGGLVFYGGFIGAILAIYIFAKFKELDSLALADILVPALPLGHAIGRIGCFINGCCFGKPYDGLLAVNYPPSTGVGYIQQEAGYLAFAAQHPLPVFPVQLLNSMTNLSLFAILLLVERRLPYKGQLLAVYLILYSGFRFTTEFWRGDYLDKTWGLTPAQLLCIIILPVGIAMLFGLGSKFSRSYLADQS